MAAMSLVNCSVSTNKSTYFMAHTLCISVEIFVLTMKTIGDNLDTTPAAPQLDLIPAGRHIGGLPAARAVDANPRSWFAITRFWPGTASATSPGGRSLAAFWPRSVPRGRARRDSEVGIEVDRHSVCTQRTHSRPERSEVAAVLICLQRNRIQPNAMTTPGRSICHKTQAPVTLLGSVAAHRICTHPDDDANEAAHH